MKPSELSPFFSTPCCDLKDLCLLTHLVNYTLPWPALEEVLEFL